MCCSECSYFNDPTEKQIINTNQRKQRGSLETELINEDCGSPENHLSSQVCRSDGVKLLHVLLGLVTLTKARHRSWSIDIS